MHIAEETFFLDPDFEGTLQQQIQHMVTQGILTGRFRTGQKLPSSRKLAKRLGISRITVTLAYNDLLSGDYLIARGRSGYYVSETAPRPPELTLPKVSQSDNVDWGRAIGQRYSDSHNITRPPDWRTYRYPFIYGQADATLFDHQNWRQCALQALGQRDFEALTSDYYERDDPKLIEFIARHILPRRGINARASQIMLTLGAQNALWLTAQVLLTQRRTAAMENPCYQGLREILSQTRCNLISIDVDENGLPAEMLPQGVDVVFTTPSHHCPTNATMPLARRRQLLSLASKNDFILVEDDYEFEMTFLNPPSPALKSLDKDGRVVHIGSFSKSLFPGLRLGYLVGSEAFIKEVRALRATVLRHPPGHIQRTAAYFLSLGHYDALINRMAQAYKQRRAVMDRAIRKNRLTPAGGDVNGGSSFWMKTPDHVDTVHLAQKLRTKGVLIEPGQVFFDPQAGPKNYYRLAYSSIPAERIPDGIALIAAALREEAEH